MTFAELQDAVLFNAFSERYRPAAKTYLRAGVRDIFRRLELGASRMVLPYDVGGRVSSATPVDLLRVDEVWTATGPAASDDHAFATSAKRRLRLLEGDESIVFGGAVGGEPECYTTRLAPPQAPAASGLSLVTQIVVAPAPVAGFVAVAGLVGPGTEMDGDSDPSPLGGELDLTLIAYARMRAFRSEDDFENGAGWEAEYERGLRNAGLGKRTSEPSQTPGSHL